MKIENYMLQSQLDEQVYEEECSKSINYKYDGKTYNVAWNCRVGVLCFQEGIPAYLPALVTRPSAQLALLRPAAKIYAGHTVMASLL